MSSPKDGAPQPHPPEDDLGSAGGKTRGSSSSFETSFDPPDEGPDDMTRGSYMELHGDVRKGQRPPEEKD